MSSLVDKQLDLEKVADRYEKDQSMGKSLTLSKSDMKFRLELELDTFADFPESKENKDSQFGNLDTALTTTQIKDGCLTGNQSNVK